MHLLLAAGADGINEHMVQAYNDEISHRTPGGAHGDEPFPGPRLSARNLAAARGEVVPPVSGAQRHRHPSLVARDIARKLDRQLNDLLWEAAQDPTPAVSQAALAARAQADKAWAEADALSKTAGNPYLVREGQRQNSEKDKCCMVTCVLQRYAHLRGLKYDVPT